MNTSIIARAGAGLLASGALVLANIGPASALTVFTSGHTDIVSVACASGTLTIDTYREDGGRISPSTIGDYEFSYDASASGGGFSYDSSADAWFASGNEVYEDDIPMIGFQYASATGTGCPASVSIDVDKASGTNAGDAIFTGNDTVAGSTSSAAGNTSRVTVWKPGTSGKPSHEHGEWEYDAPSTGGDFTLRFRAYTPSSPSTPVATISPVHVHVQP